jgi:hypothetical protein
LSISRTLKENSYDLAISQFALNSRKAMANSEYQHKLWFLETGGHTNLTGLSYLALNCTYVQLEVTVKSATIITYP